MPPGGLGASPHRYSGMERCPRAGTLGVPGPHSLYLAQPLRQHPPAPSAPDRLDQHFQLATHRAAGDNADPDLEPPFD